MGGRDGRTRNSWWHRRGILRAYLEHPRDLLGASWALLWALLWGLLGAHWHFVGASWVHLERILGYLRRAWGPLGGLLKVYWWLVGALWGFLGRLGQHLCM